MHEFIRGIAVGIFLARLYEEDEKISESQAAKIHRLRNNKEFFRTFVVKQKIKPIITNGRRFYLKSEVNRLLKTEQQVFTGIRK